MNFNPQKVRLIIFDFDGVLINKVPNEVPASLLQEFAEEGGFFNAGSTISFKGTDWISELEKMGIDTGDQEVLAGISRKMFECYKSKISLYDWVGELIPELAKTKRLAILTNNCLATVSHCLNGLEPYFSAIKTWESVPELKPAPDGLLSICSELGIAPDETLVVGDSREDSDAASEAGAMSVIITSGERPKLGADQG